MTMHRWPTPPGTLEPGSITRHQAAQLLKLARSGAGEVVAEAIDWAYAAMPDRAIVHRLKIRSLLRNGNHESADAAIAQSLLLYPVDPVLSTMRAERLLAKGQLESASREIGLVLARHPERPTALALGADIARRRGDTAQAIALLERAVDVRSEDAALRIALIEALLDDEEHVRAARELALLIDPPALLEARVLRACGQLIDALARLEAEWSAGENGEHADLVASGIVELLEITGQLDRLERFVTELTVDHPGALSRAAEACLVLGRFEDAMRLGAALLRRRAFVPMGRGILLVAATLKGSFGVAERAARQLSTSERTIDRITLAELWRRGMIGRLISRATTLDTENAGRHPSVLATLAQSAGELFRELLTDAEIASNPGEAAELIHQIRLCEPSMPQRPDVQTATSAAPEALANELGQQVEETSSGVRRAA